MDFLAPRNLLKVTKHFHQHLIFFFFCRAMLLDQLYDDLTKRTELMCGLPLQYADNISTSSLTSDTPKDGGSGFFDAFKVNTSEIFALIFKV